MSEIFSTEQKLENIKKTLNGLQIHVGPDTYPPQGRQPIMWTTRFPRGTHNDHWAPRNKI
jgi:hypothetical protein